MIDLEKKTGSKMRVLKEIGVLYMITLLTHDEYIWVSKLFCQVIRAD